MTILSNTVDKNLHQCALWHCIKTICFARQEIFWRQKCTHLRLEEGGYADVNIVDLEEKMSDNQGRLLRVGTQTAASGVLAISLQKPVALAATLCLPPGEFHCKPDAFRKSMIFQQSSLSMYVQVELCCAAVIAIY